MRGSFGGVEPPSLSVFVGDRRCTREAWRHTGRVDCLLPPGSGQSLEVGWTPRAADFLLPSPLSWSRLLTGLIPQVSVHLGMRRLSQPRAFTYDRAVLRGIDTRGAAAATTVSLSAAFVDRASTGATAPVSGFDRPVVDGQQILVRGEHFSGAASVLCAFGRGMDTVPASVLSDSEALCIVRAAHCAHSSPLYSPSGMPPGWGHRFRRSAHKVLPPPKTD